MVVRMTNSTFRFSSFSHIAFALSFVLLLVALPGVIFADDKDDDNIPEPEDLTVETSDAVLIRCTYYPSRLKDPKDAIPIMMIPGWDGRRNEYDYLATRLQSIGYACITVDLRGHGESKNRKQGYPALPTLKRMRPADIGSMQLDLDAVKMFLRKENDAERLNLEALTIVASEFSTVLATNWVIREYSWPNYPGRRQGKNVKALVLLSPMQKSEGLTCIKSLTHAAVLSQSFLLVSGSADSNSGYRQSFEFYKKLERGVPKPDETVENPIAQRRLFYVKKPVTIQGTLLLNPKLGLKTDADIARFLKLRLVDNLDQLSWSRRSPEDD